MQPLPCQITGARQRSTMGHMHIAVLLVAFAMGCGGGAATQPPPSPSETPTGPEREIGYVPDERGGDPEGDSQLARAIELGAQGHLDDARALLIALMHRDLPTTARALTTRNELRSLRRDPEIAATREALTTRYLEAAQRGAPLVAYEVPRVRWEEHGDLGDDTGRVASRAVDQPIARVQAGVYLHDEQRFVPLAPWIESRSSEVPGRNWHEPPIAAAMYDPETRRVYAVTGTDPDDDEAPFVRNPVLTIHDVPLGDVLLVHAIDYNALYSIYPTREGALIAGSGGDAADARWHSVDRDGAEDAHDDTPHGQRHLSVQQDGWGVLFDPPPGVQWDETAITTERGLFPVEAFAIVTDRSLIIEGDWLIAAQLVSNTNQCSGDHDEEHAVDRFDMRSSRMTTLSDREGAAQILVGGDGALYVGTREGVFRFADIGAMTADRVALRLAISSRPLDCLDLPPRNRMLPPDGA